MSAEDEKTKRFAFHIRFSDQLAFAGAARWCCQRRGRRLVFVAKVPASSRCHVCVEAREGEKNNLFGECSSVCHGGFGGRNV